MSDLTTVLNLLARTGNVEALQEFAHVRELDIPTQLIEAKIYHIIHQLADSIESEIDLELVAELERFSEYWNRTDNGALICDLLDVLILISQAEIGIEDQAKALDFLAINTLAWAIRRNLTDPSIGQRMRELVTQGYELVLYPIDVTKTMVEKYFPIVDQWCSLVPAEQLVDTTIEELVEHLSYQREINWEWLSYLIAKLKEMTSARKVSELFHYHYHSLANTNAALYQQLVERKWIEDDAVITNRSALRQALFEFETSFNAKEAADRIFESVKDKIDNHFKAQISQKLVEWLKMGRLGHIWAVYKCRTPVYNLEFAREQISALTRVAVYTENYDLLLNILGLPIELINTDDPELKDLVVAYACINCPRSDITKEAAEFEQEA